MKKKEGRILAVERTGVPIATGSNPIPQPRSEADTDTLIATAGDVTSAAYTTTATGKILSETYGPYDISNFYAGDLILFNYELVNRGAGGGGATQIQVWAIEVEGVSFADGIPE